MKLTEKYFKFNDELLQKFNLKQFEVNLTEKLVKGQEENKNDFKDLLEKEYFSNFSLQLETLKAMIDEYFDTYKQGNSPLADEINKLEKGIRAHYFGEFIIKNILISKNYWLLPWVSISAGLHIALPYCDYFLTERNLCGMIKNSYLKFDEVFKCNVITNPKDTVNHLSSIKL